MYGLLQIRFLILYVNNQEDLFIYNIKQKNRLPDMIRIAYIFILKPIFYNLYKGCNQIQGLYKISSF